ncbi:MAG: SDR family NAD(P)-dependent oxidoreductase, partial [bacterium]|nr:SDR family NAD(P)-dependent oxidoreductase [bacterium]
MDLGLKDKVAFITGASRGIGKGIAVSLAREGCKVALTATRADLLAAVSQEIEVSFGVEVAWWTGDLLKSEDAKRVVDAAAAHFGRIDIVVNNAGAAPGGVLDTLSDE